jgi:type I restriction enzyme S subunit
MTTWSEVPIKDVAFFQEGPGLRNWQWTENGVKVINGRNVLLDGQIDLANTDKFISWGEFQCKYKHFGIQVNDIVVTSSGTLGKVGRIKPEHLPLMMNTSVIRFHSSNSTVLNDDYLFCYLRSSHFQQQIIRYAIGAAQANFGPSHIKLMSMPLPPLLVQQRIAGILSAYDELIENSRGRIGILETMARLLYREWFANFRFPGHEKVRRVSSVLGEIPEGWKIEKLGDILELQYGKALKTENRNGGPIPVYGSSGILGNHDAALSAGPGIIVGRKGNVGSVFWCDSSFFVIDTAYYVTSSLPLRYLFYLLPTLHFINNDTAVPGLSRAQAYSLRVIVPPNELLAKFCRIADHFALCAGTLRRQVHNLRSTRDLLLPRLLGGQISLPQDIASKEFDSSFATEGYNLAPTSPLVTEELARSSTELADKRNPEPATQRVPTLDDDRIDVLCVIRTIFNDDKERERDAAIRELAHALGHQRTGSRVYDALSTGLQTAVRRGIIVNVGGVYRRGFRTLADCTRDSLKKDLESAIGRGWISREDAVRALARWLGFGRVGPIIEETGRSLINGLIREGRLETNGTMRIRRP